MIVKCDDRGKLYLPFSEITFIEVMLLAKRYNPDFIKITSSVMNIFGMRKKAIAKAK